MKKTLQLFSILMCILLSFQSFAQSIEISGTVTSDEDGSPLPGVNVVLKGTTKGVLTNADGKYSISAPSNGTLVITYLGFLSQEIAVNNRNIINVALVNDAQSLNELVVTAYGQTAKRELTGSQVSIKGDVLNNIPITTIEQGLQGRTPGVQMTQGSGKLGSAMQIRVRGAASISAGNEPLYVIDNIPVTSQSQNSAVTEPINPLADLNPADIESIEILKDASAAALFGSRASNGVVMITTKKGKSGRTNVNVSYLGGTATPTYKGDFMNAKEYTDFFRMAAENEGYDLEEELDSELGTYDLNNDTRWSDESFQKGSFSQANFNISGGNDKTRFYIAGGLSDQVGILLGNSYKRNNIRVNLDHTVSKKFKIGTSIAISKSLNNFLPDDNAFSNPLQLNALPPIQQKIDPETNELNRNTIYYNNILDVKYGFNRGTSYRTFANLNGTYQILKNLSFTSEYGMDLMSFQEEQFRGFLTETGGARDGYAYQNQRRNLTWTTNNLFNYNQSFGKSNLDILAGVTYQEGGYVRVMSEGTNLPSDKFTKIASAAVISSGSSEETKFSVLSYLARASYKINNRYIFGLSGRLDGSSRFGDNNRYGFFPAATAAWILTDEDFLKSSNTISFLKLRTSYGYTGNSEIGNFDSRSLWAALPYAEQSGIEPVRVGNPNLRWETTAQFDVGVDFGLLKDRLTGTIDFYNRDTRDLLLNRPVPATTGFTIVTENIGSLNNKGIEFSLNARAIDKDLKWDIGFNISRNINKVTELNGDPITPGGRFLNRVAVGEPIGYFYGVAFAGADSETGDALFYIDETRTTTTNDYSEAKSQKLGNPNPKFTGGLTNTLAFKGFDLSILSQFVSGNKIYNVAGGFQSASGDYFDNQTRDQLNAWTENNKDTDIPQARLYGANGTQVSSRWLQDGSFFRIKNITLGYNIPRNLVNKIKVTNARVFVTAQNVLTFTKYNGYDPEVNTFYSATTSQNANILIGSDFYTPPQQKTIAVGINLGF